ncbi:MAG: four-carbon acid sugar kinase family protein [Gammaproteobacteria bacterium]|nr:four-carbon acid sugar kinase family protein [Gammaproteobacteria bacterium]
MNNFSIGVIADDFTGATDIASMLVRGGLTVVQTIGIPTDALMQSLECDAVVIALKSRSIAAELAIEQSLAALMALSKRQPKQIYFKYCSTFDSTQAGNIGPVADALAMHLNCQRLVHVPALPINGRTVYKGHLFVFDQLLSESGMQNHPINPMTDSNLVRWLAHQTPNPVNLLPLELIRQSSAAVKDQLQLNTSEALEHTIADTTTTEDLLVLAQALQHQPLICGGSGLATPLAQFHKEQNSDDIAREPLLKTSGSTLLLAGSCSNATLEQISSFIASGGVARRLDPLDIDENSSLIDDTIQWAKRALEDQPVLIYTSGDKEQIAKAQHVLGVEQASVVAEAAMSRVASKLAGEVNLGRIVVAGGETSGAVTNALGINALKIGQEIAPGVPWTQAMDANGEPLVQLALKSGNFGGSHFFNDALET